MGLGLYNRAGQQNNQNRPQNSGNFSRPFGGGNNNQQNNQPNQNEYKDLIEALTGATAFVNSTRSKNVTGTEVRSEFVGIVDKFRAFAKKLEKSQTQQDGRNALFNAAGAIELLYKNRKNEVITFQLIVFKHDTWNLVAELLNTLIKKFNFQNLKLAQIRHRENFTQVAQQINERKIEEYQQQAQVAVEQGNPPPPPPRAATPAEVETLTGLTPVGADFDAVEETLPEIAPVISKLEIKITNLNQEAETSYLEEISRQLDDNKVNTQMQGRLITTNTDDVDMPAIDDAAEAGIEEDPLLINKLNKDTAGDAGEELPDTFNVHDTEFFEDLEKNKAHAAIWYGRRDFNFAVKEIIRSGITYIAKATSFSDSLKIYTKQSSSVLNTADNLISRFEKEYGFKSLVVKGLPGKDKPELSEDFYNLNDSDQQKELTRASSAAHAFVQRPENEIKDSDGFDGILYSEAGFRKIIVTKDYKEDPYDYRIKQSIWDKMHKFYLEKKKHDYFSDSNNNSRELSDLDYSIINYLTEMVPVFLNTADQAITHLIGSDAIYILDSSYVGTTVNDMMSEIETAIDHANNAEKVDTKSEVKKYFQKEFGDDGNTLYGYIYNIHKFFDQLLGVMSGALRNASIEMEAMEEIESFLGNDSTDITIWDDDIGQALTTAVKKRGADKSNIGDLTPEILKDYMDIYNSGMYDSEDAGGLFADVKTYVIVTAIRMYRHELNQWRN